MTRAPTPSTQPTYGMAAIIGGVLCVLLYAVLRLALRRAAGRGEELEGTVALVLEAEAGIDFDFEPYVEWVAVPAPWRNGKLLRPWHAAALSVPLPCRFRRLGAFGRGPPRRDVTSDLRWTGREGLPARGISRACGVVL